MQPRWQQRITVTLLILLPVAYLIHEYIQSQGKLRTFTAPMRFAVTNDVAYFFGDHGRYWATNAENVALLKTLQAEMVFVTVEEYWAKGRRVKWRVVEATAFGDKKEQKLTAP